MSSLSIANVWHTLLLGSVYQQGHSIRLQFYPVFETLMHALLNWMFWQKTEAKSYRQQRRFWGFVYLLAAVILHVAGLWPGYHIIHAFM